ncbi:MAG: 4Fe-4S dicluster domain-containing protein [Chloroflexi bacterium]|nr:4Fe-4S dicluster domain-containing protein [Chloroflexota bacterium]
MAEVTKSRALLSEGLQTQGESGLYRCVNCGFCLNQCPTYIELGLETESPRGRLSLMKAMSEGRLELTKGVIGHLGLCLQCRACEAVCPSGVPFGRLMETARAGIVQHQPGSLGTRLVRSIVFQGLLPHPRRLALLATLLRFYQRSGLGWAMERTQVLRLLSPRLARMNEILPPLPGKPFSTDSRIVPSLGNKAQRKVAFFSGCVMSMIYAEVNEATLRVLSKNGCEVVVPREQVCCGALHVHSGERDIAKNMARRNIDAFMGAEIDTVVVNSAGCGALLKEYGVLLEDDPLYAHKARHFAGMVKDVTELLTPLPLEPGLGEIKKRVTYQDPCHLAHAQRISQEPRQILKSIPGIELVEMEDASLCCGAAGIYSITQSELSTRLLERKVRNIAATGVEVVVAPNPGCMLQLRLGLKRAGLNVRVAHLVELLDEAYARSTPTYPLKI